MKIRFTQPVDINATHWIPGQEVEFPARLAETLLARGWAVDVDAPIPEPEKPVVDVVEAVAEDEESAEVVEVEEPKKPAAKKPGSKGKKK